MPASPPVTPLRFELRARKTEDAPADVPDQPAILRNAESGSHAAVYAEAERLNKMMLTRPGKPTHFFFPEVVGSGTNWRNHCDACRMLAAKQARDDD